jgi:Ca-activated chloride channel family protein
MNFLEPLLLIGLLLVPLLLGLYVLVQRRRSRYAVRFTNLDLLANLAPKRPSWRRHLPTALYLGAVAALVLALARPTMVLAVPRDDATVILTIDVSGSMKATDVSPTRLAAAQAAAESFITQLPPQIRVGLVAFSTEVHSLVAPTTDRGAVQAAIEGLTPEAGTSMGDAMDRMLDIAQSIQAADTSFFSAS